MWGYSELQKSFFSISFFMLWLGFFVCLVFLKCKIAHKTTHIRYFVHTKSSSRYKSKEGTEVTLIDFRYGKYLPEDTWVYAHLKNSKRHSDYFWLYIYTHIYKEVNYCLKAILIRLNIVKKSLKGSTVFISYVWLLRYICVAHSIGNKPKL